MSDPNLPNGEQPKQPTTPLQPPSVSEPELTSQLPSDFQPGPAVPPPATTPLPAGASVPPPPGATPPPPGVTPPAPQQPGASQPGASQPGQAPYGGVPPQGPQSPQGGYGSGGYPPAAPKGLAIASLIIGIASLVFFWAWFIGILGGIAAVILGILALRKRQSKGMSLTGVITGGVAVLAGIGALIFSLFILGSVMNATGAAVDDYEQMTEELETASPAPSESELDDAAEGAAEGAADAAADSSSGTGEDVGERSAEFCDALTAFSTLGASGELTPEVLDSLKPLADISSPNQSVYERFYEYAKDPTSVDDSSTLISDYFDAVTDDAMACV
ncbi:DUF4190 domain-containing protein [Leucobacter sp. L43]|uniref:DUF4190 domain-containing protein n=1 Tax=Leucobacter sp. L43 TaxID=2798040 RepID=UPI0019047D11|nr:DUF4190 domain-containing protein [Leucobacter sp. L43]